MKPNFSNAIQNCLLTFVFILATHLNCLSQELNVNKDLILSAGVNYCEVYRVEFSFGEASQVEIFQKIISYNHGYVSALKTKTGRLKEYKYENNILKKIIVSYTDEWNNKHIEAHQFEYDINGMAIKELIYSDRGDLLYKIEYEYDQYSNIVLSKTIEKNGEVSDVTKNIYSYINNNSLIGMKTIFKYENIEDYKSNTFSHYEKILFEYEDNNRVKEEQHYFNEDLKSKSKKINFFYNENGLIKKMIYYDFNNEPLYQEIFRYD